MSRTSTHRALLALLASMCSIQFGATLAKRLFPLMGAPAVTCLRLAFASVLMLAWARPWKKMPSKDGQRAVFYYGLALGAMNYLFYQALTRIPLGIAVAVEFLGPATVSLCLSRRAIDFAWTGVAALGIILLAPSPNADLQLDPIGVLYALGAAVGWASYIVFGQRAGNTMNGGTAASLGMVVASLSVLPVGITMSGSALYNVSLWPVAMLVAIFSSALPYSLEMFALKSLPARRFGVLMSLEPAIAATSGWLFLGENLTTKQSLAIVCVIAASLGSTLTAAAATARSMAEPIT